MPRFEIRTSERVSENKKQFFIAIGITHSGRAYFIDKIDKNKGRVIIDNHYKWGWKTEWKTFEKIVSFEEWDSNYYKPLKTSWVHYSPNQNLGRPKRDKDGHSTLCGKTAVRIQVSSKKEIVTCPRCIALLDNKNYKDTHS